MKNKKNKKKATKKAPNVLIFNAVPTNNGDAALVFSLLESFENKGYNVKIAANHYDLIGNIYKDKPIIQEMGDSSFWKKFRYFKFFKKYNPLLFYWFSPSFLKCDVLVASPGGYINSYYGFNKVAMTFKIAKFLGKKTIVYSQSIGPLDLKGEKEMKSLANYLDLIYVRDEFSMNIMEKLNLKKNNYKLTEDAAFLFEFDKSRDSEKSKIVAISVRDWKHDNRSTLQFYHMIEHFVKIVINYGYSVEFISTCQGINEYVDDSEVAQRIYDGLEEEYKRNVLVNKTYFNLDDFREYIKKFHIVIGTRLHMCILAMIAGIPSFNISYEIKGKEVYRYCDLEKYSVDYNDEISNAIKSFERFLQDKNDIRKKLPEIIKERNDLANKAFNGCIRIINEKKYEN